MDITPGIKKNSELANIVGSDDTAHLDLRLATLYSLNLSILYTLADFFFIIFDLHMSAVSFAFLALEG